MQLSLVTINYNGADRTNRLIASLVDQSDPSFDLYVVDNGSDAGDRERVRNAVARTSFVFINADGNLGFSGGNNVAIRRALEDGADWIVLINNDATVGSDFIAQLKIALEDSQKIVAIPLREGDHTAYGGIIEWLAPTLCHCRDFLHAKMLAHHEKLYAVGAGMAIPRRYFGSVGLLDDAYFLYFEDADFCARALRRGLLVEPVEGPVIRHEPSSTTSALGASILLRYHWRNALRFNSRNAPAVMRFLLPFWLAGALFKQAVKMAVMPERAQYAKAITAGINDWLKGRTGHIS